MTEEYNYPGRFGKPVSTTPFTMRFGPAEQDTREAALYRIIHRQQAIIDTLMAQLEREPVQVDSLRDVGRGEQAIPAGYFDNLSQRRTDGSHDAK